MQAPGFCGEKVAQGIGGIVTAKTLVGNVGFEDVGWVIGIVLEIWEATDKPLAALVKIERGLGS